MGRGAPLREEGEESALCGTQYTFTPHTYPLCRMRIHSNLVCASKGTKQELLLLITATYWRKTVLCGKHGIVLPGPPSTGLLASASPTSGERWNRKPVKSVFIHGIIPQRRRVVILSERLYRLSTADEMLSSCRASRSVLPKLIDNIFKARGDGRRRQVALGYLDRDRDRFGPDDESA